MTTSKHRIENKRRRILRQEAQGDVSYLQWDEGEKSLPPPAEGLSEYRGSMFPKNLALKHPTADLLLQYAEGGCPVQTGKPWSHEQMQAAIERGNHASAKDPAAVEQFAAEIAGKEASGQCRVVLWDDIRENPPRQLKVSPLAAIPHKSRAFHAILDLSFRVKLESGHKMPSVNEASTKTAPSGAIDQLVHLL